MSSFVLNEQLTQLVTSRFVLNQRFIFCKFLQISKKLKEIVYCSKRPIGLLFHALSVRAIKIKENFVAIAF